MWRSALLALVIMMASTSGCLWWSDDDTDAGTASLEPASTDAATRPVPSEPAANETLEPQPEPQVEPSPEVRPRRLLAPSTPLWWNPQTQPHPAFGWPTLTNVPDEAPDWWRPVPGSPVPAGTPVMDPITRGPIERGTGLALFGRLAVVPGQSAGTSVLDISDPSSPAVLSTYEAPGRDTDIIAYPDGRLVAVHATTAAGLFVYEITDPTAPVLLAQIDPEGGTHNVAVVPGTPLLYNAGDAGRGGSTEIYDLSRPDEPALIERWDNGYGCHDITFHIDARVGEYRAYCAGTQATQIWDLAKPRSPEVVTTIPAPPVTPGTDTSALPSAGSTAIWSHMAIANPARTILLVGDETTPAYACDASVDAGDRTASGPLGNVWVYDITDESSPQLVSWIGPNPVEPADVTNATPKQTGTGCSVHFGRPVPHATRDLFALAAYGAGVLLVDLTDPTKPSIVDQWAEGAYTWDVWYYNGHLYTGDEKRGMDVIALV